MAKATILIRPFQALKPATTIPLLKILNLEMSQERNVKNRHYNRMLNKTTDKKGNKSTVSVNKKKRLRR